MTHKEKVLQLLSDNQPHSHMEGYRLGVMLHSRVDDLRHDDGYTIKCWHEDGKYWYQLFGTVRTGDAAEDGAVGDTPSPVRTVLGSGPPETPSASKTPSGADGDVGGSRSLPREGRQPTLWEAA